MKHLRILLFVVIASAILGPGCFKEAVDVQIRYQDFMFAPYKDGKCWTLGYKINAEEYRHLIQRYKTQLQEHSEMWGASIVTTYLYSDAKSDTFELTQPFYNPLRIDYDLTDCDDWEFDVEEEHHLFFDPANYPDFQRIHKHEYVGADTTYTITQSNFHDGVTYDTSFYLYEELYFEPNGDFHKRVFLDEGCNYITITGTWIFNTPFGKFPQAGNGEPPYVEIIMNYDQADVAGIMPPSNLFILRQEGSNEIAMNILQHHTVSSSSFLATRGSFTAHRDNFTYKPTLLNSSFAWQGKIVRHLDNCCFEIHERPDDMVTIQDDLTLITEKKFTTESIYFIRPVRCPEPGTCTMMCTQPMCGNKSAAMYHAGGLIDSHISGFSISADSSIWTISNFAGLGGSLDIVMNSYYWNMCHGFPNDEYVIDGHDVFIFDFNGYGANPLTGNTAVEVVAMVDGEERTIYYE